MALSIFTDGGSRENLGPSDSARVVYDQLGSSLFFIGFFIPRATNSEVKYLAIIGVLSDVFHFYLEPIIIYVDS